MTIRKRLTLAYATLLTVIIVFFGATTYGVMRFTMLSDIDSGLAETASLITRNSRVYPDPTFGAEPRINIELASLDTLRAPGVYVQAWEHVGGNYEFKQASLTAEGLDDTALDPESLGTRQDVIRSTTVEGLDMRVLTKPIAASGGGDRVVGYIQVAVGLEQINRATDTLLAVMVIACGVAIVGAGLLSMIFSDRALRPIEDITGAAASIANTNDLQTRLEWRGPPDELGRLTNVFNQMMERIEHLFSVQQRFVADISHELRTPLTAIQGHCDLMKRYGLDDSSMEAIDAETTRMGRLVNDLLMLARADYGGIQFERYPIDLDTLVMETFSHCKGLVGERKLDMRLGLFEPVRVYGNSDRIKQVLVNLVNNAIKFTGDGGEIVIGLENINQHAVLWVKDTGIGISEEDKHHVFDRFFQTETSRHHFDDEGFGLGLSIAKWIVEAHEGTIGVNSVKGEGTTFTVTLPEYQDGAEDAPDFTRATRPRIPIIGKADKHRPATKELHIVKPDTRSRKRGHRANSRQERENRQN